MPLPPDQYNLSYRLVSMDAASAHIQAVSAPPFVFGSTATDQALVLDVTRQSNDALADFVAGEPARLVALGSVPIGIEGAVDEATRCIDELGMSGLTMGTYGGGRELDNPANEPIWTFLEERQLFCLVHPSRASSPERLRDYHLVQLLGYPAETALAASRLIFGGVLDRHDLILCLAHGGGCLQGPTPRLTIGWERKSETQTVPNPPMHYIERLHFDTAVFEGEVLNRLFKEVGPSHVLLGTDTPFDLADLRSVSTVNELAISKSAKKSILAGNAARLMPRLSEIADIEV